MGQARGQGTREQGTDWGQGTGQEMRELGTRDWGQGTGDEGTGDKGTGDKS